MSNEKIYYQDPDVTITNARAVFGDKTYSVSNITSVVKGTIPPVLWPRVILSLLTFGLLFLLPIIGLAFQGWFFISIIIVLILQYMIWGWWKAKPTWIVKISSASGEIDAFRSTDESRIQSIITGINQSIIDRG